MLQETQKLPKNVPSTSQEHPWSPTICLPSTKSARRGPNSSQTAPPNSRRAPRACPKNALRVLQECLQNPIVCGHICIRTWVHVLISGHAMHRTMWRVCTHHLLLYITFYYTSPCATHHLLLYITFYYTSPSAIHHLLLHITFYHSLPSSIRHILLYNTFYYTSPSTI